MGLSIPLILLLIASAAWGLVDVKLYAAESANWQAQSFGQDIVDLFVIAPLLIVATILACRGREMGLVLWGGTVAYLSYTFTIFCFDVHFNKLFIVYCFILGLSFYSTAWFVHGRMKNNNGQTVTGYVHKITGIYFLIISVLFFLLWLSDIMPGITNEQLPKSLADTGLYTNPVQVIDIAIFLPAIFLTGLFLLKKKIFAVVLTPAMLLFMLLMDITIAALVVVMTNKGIAGDIAVVYGMGALALISLVLLFANTNYDYTHKT